MQQDVTAILGLSIEPLTAIQSQLQSLPPSPGSDLTKDPTKLAERVVKHLLNYLSGFTGGSPLGPDALIPMNIVAKWYENFIGKVKAGGVGFLERGD